MLASAVVGGEHRGRIATRSGVVLLALAVTVPSAESFAFTPGVTRAAGSRLFSMTPSLSTASPAARVHSLASASDLRRPGRCRGTILMGRSGRGADVDEEEGGPLAGRESTTSVGKGVRVLQKLLDKLERRAEKIEGKISRKVAKWDSKLSSRLGKSDEGEPLSASEGIKGALVKASKSPYLVPVAIGVSVLAVPASLTAFTIMMIAAQVFCSPRSGGSRTLPAPLTLASPNTHGGIRKRGTAQTSLENAGRTHPDMLAAAGRPHGLVAALCAHRSGFHPRSAAHRAPPPTCPLPGFDLFQLPVCWPARKVPVVQDSACHVNGDAASNRRLVDLDDPVPLPSARFPGRNDGPHETFCPRSFLPPLSHRPLLPRSLAPAASPCPLHHSDNCPDPKNHGNALHGSQDCAVCSLPARRRFLLVQERERNPGFQIIIKGGFACDGCRGQRGGRG
jgi:hypothetical protein